ncbi:MAG: NAD(P)/FAD-dependent oxidoreductase [Paucimonas sp.]|jgi:phytoene dehydrogenase-like protein|uniref:phytoene desaturase family protein n=1 Tax=Pantoea sp. Cy-639 TaxID=2608360 RepID=UPI0014201929|nr:NAD(P)/FAD-dependent oxidoreductase [Pantoea sp. Cy-639]MDR2307973.1 NAD(P)/FAD-dependent oxidoreductase [Paucimonas sp.]NIF16598.1 NAD(P)/FAD-dependent oxidoreductase [Pantoea sp. Cy-639]
MTGQAWDAIFVGAGITSLACAAMLAQRQPGLRLLLIDKHIVAGGYASVFRRPRQDATFDCSLHKLSGMQEGGNLIRILRQLGLDQSLELVYPHDYFCAYRGDEALALANDVDQVQQQLLARFPGQAEGIAQFFEQVATFGRNGYYQFQMLDGSFEPDIAQLRYAHRHLKHKTVREGLAELFSDPLLIEILAAPGIYVGGYPEDLGYLYYLHVVYATLNRGNAYVRGASEQLSAQLVQRIEQGGGQVLLSTRVEKVLDDGQGKVRGVATSRGEFLAPRVYINASPHYAVEHLFAADTPLAPVRQKLANLKPARSTTTVYLVLDQAPESLGLAHSESMLFADAPASAGPARDAAALAGHPHALSEQAYWQLSPMEVTNYHLLDPEGGRVVCLNVLDAIDQWPQRRTPEYRAKKQRAAEVLVERLLTAVPGLRGHVLHTEVATPHTYVRFTNNTAGSGYGAMVGTDLSGHVFHHGFPLAGVHFLSAWVAGPSYEAAFGYAEMKAGQWVAA